MRIVHIITGLNTGGAERMLERLALHPSADAEHIVISLGARGPVGQRLVDAGVTVLALNLRRAGLALVVPRLARIVRRLRPDVVQTWLYHADVLGGLAARIARAPAIAWSIRTADTRAGISLSRSARAILRLSARLSRHVPDRIVYCAHAARRAHEAEGYDPARGIVIQNGFLVPDPDTIAADAAALRAALGIPAGARLVGTAGTFTPQKNQTGFLAACAPALAAYPDLHVLVIGAGNTPANHALAEAAAATGHAERVHLLGERRDIAACLAALDLFCLASRGEGFPNVLGEAMAVATPVLSTDVGDAAALVGDTGTIVPVDDPAALRDALRSLLGRAPAELARSGTLGRDRIRARFTLDAIMGEYLDLYRSMTGDSV